MKRISIITMLMMMALPCYGAGENVPTSRGYVDTALDAKQAKFPAAGTAGVGAGDSVMTFTSTSGVTGERALYTDASSYDESTDADKMITASALNGAITSMPTTTTTKLNCANPGTCNLWTITDQTAYAGASSGGGDSGGDSGGGSAGASAETLAMLQALISTNGTGRCYKSLKDGTVSAGTCTTAPTGYGDWGATFTYNNETVQISGISACSSVDEGLSMGGIPTNQSGIDADYATSGSGSTANTNPPGKFCYCKMQTANGEPAESRWVFDYAVSSSSDCSVDCARYCGVHVRNDSGFRSGVIGAVQ